MRIRIRWRWLVLLGVLLLFSGCGGSDGGGGGGIVEPGLVGVDDSPLVAGTAPELFVDYVLPGNPNTIVSVSILSDQPSDGDIAFDPFLNDYTITEGPDFVQFGVDSLDPNRPEYRAFLDFPLDGSTLDPAIPTNAIIVAAEVALFVDFVDFSARVPALIDLVIYPIGALGISDYASIPLAVQSFVFLDSDVGSDVFIDVTDLMVVAQDQVPALVDFQLRLLVP